MTETPIAARLHCCAPYCRRSHRNDEGYAEWLCGEHYGLADPVLRQRKAHYQRRQKLAERRCDPASIESAERLSRIANFLWRKIKRQAIERALGI